MSHQYHPRSWRLLLILALFLPSQTAAQTVRGSVVEAGTGQPLVGAYGLVAELIGYASTESGWFDLVAGDVATYHMEVPVQAVPLDGIAVLSESRCRSQPEAYRRAGEVAARFSGAAAACGVIAIWTTRGEP